FVVLGAHVDAPAEIRDRDVRRQAEHPCEVEAGGGKPEADAARVPLAAHAAREGEAAAVEPAAGPERNPCAVGPDPAGQLQLAEPERRAHPSPRLEPHPGARGRPPAEPEARHGHGRARRRSSERVRRCKGRLSRPNTLGYQEGTMGHPALLDRERSLLILIDFQEGYRNALHAWERVAVACRLLVEGMAILGVPILVTEQYPRGLGHTAPEVAGRFPTGLQVVEKMSMSCCGAGAFTERLAASGRRQVLIAGIETHACVNQTVHDLLALGYQVQVARDATSSRRPADVAPAGEKMRAGGMLPTSSEQALLELVRTAESAGFKALQRLLKETPPPRE